MKLGRAEFLLLLLGLLLLTAGAFWIYRPLGPLVAGIYFITAAYMSARQRK